MSSSTPVYSSFCLCIDAAIICMRIPNALHKVLPAQVVVVKNTTLYEDLMTTGITFEPVSRTYLTAVVETARGATAAGAKAAAEVARIAPRARVNFIVAVKLLEKWGVEALLLLACRDEWSSCEVTFSWKTHEGSCGCSACGLSVVFWRALSSLSNLKLSIFVSWNQAS